MGPAPVVRITTPLEEMAPFYYMVSPFPILGMLIAECLRINKNQALNLGFAIVALVVISSCRLALRLPISGHSFLFSYFVLRRLFIISNAPRYELWTGVLLLAGMCYMKLVWWTDPITLGVGMASGCVLFFCRPFKNE